MVTPVLSLRLSDLQKHNTQTFCKNPIFQGTHKAGNTVFPAQQRLLQPTSQIKTEINRLL